MIQYAEIFRILFSFVIMFNINYYYDEIRLLMTLHYIMITLLCWYNILNQRLLLQNFASRTSFNSWSRPSGQSVFNLRIQRSYPFFRIRRNWSVVGGFVIFSIRVSFASSWKLRLEVWQYLQTKTAFLC